MSGVAEISLVKVSDCCEILDNHRIPLNSEERDKIPGDVPYYGANGVQGYISKHLFDEDLILIAEDGGNFDQYAERSIAYRISGKSWVNNHAHILRARSDYDQNFVFYSLEHKNICSVIKGGTRSKLNQSELREITIWDAPRRDQQKIAHILTTVDNLIEKTQALIDKYTAVKQGMMHDLFTRGIDLATGQLRPSYEQAPELYKETELGWVPREWGVFLLDTLAERGSGHTPSKSYPEYWNGGIKWVSLADSNKLDNLYVYDTDKNISELGVRNSSAVKHPAGTVILSRDAGIGKSAILSEEMAVSQHFMAWRCGKSMDSYFLYFWMQYKKPIFEAIAMGSTIATIGLGFFKKLKIATTVGVSEQEAIGRKILRVHQYIAKSEEVLEHYQQIKKGLMQDLLTGKVTVT